MTTAARLQELTDLSLQSLADPANSYGRHARDEASTFRPRRGYMTGRRQRLPAFTPTVHDDASRRFAESRSQD